MDLVFVLELVEVCFTFLVLGIAPLGSFRDLVVLGTGFCVGGGFCLGLGVGLWAFLCDGGEGFWGVLVFVLDLELVFVWGLELVEVFFIFLGLELVFVLHALGFRHAFLVLINSSNSILRRCCNASCSSFSLRRASFFLKHVLSFL